MEKATKKSFLLTANERELMNMPMQVILEEVAQHFNDLKEKAQGKELSSKVATELDKRLGHASLLYAEGSRLAITHSEEGHRLIAASIYWQDQRGLELLAEADKAYVLRRVAEIEEEKRKKREEELKKRRGIK